MPATIRINREQRDGLYEVTCNHLGSAGDLVIHLDQMDYAKAERLGLELAEDIRLMQDLGWGGDEGRRGVELTMPRCDLMGVLERLQGEAGLVLGDTEESREDAETRQRFIQGRDACKRLRAELDPPDRAEAAPAEAGSYPAEDGEPRPCDLVDDGVILAAAERAECHEQAEAVWVDVLTEHLGLEPEPATDASLLPRLESLRRAGLLTSTERRGEPHWGLTDAGREKLADLREAGEVGDLPESPQHRAWRQARVKAALRIDGLREELDQAIEAADRIHAAASLKARDLFALSERLRWTSWRFASATYCLTEWAEPHDDYPDEDETPGPHPGRRTTSAWDRPIAELGGRP